jgi:nitrogen regulatory protein P-II 1
VKLVVALLRPHAVDPVRTALGTFGVRGMTLSQVTGFGVEMWRTHVYRGRVIHDESVSNVRIEVVVSNDDVESVVSIILKAAASPNSGAGKIWVLPVDAAARVRTGERGLDAL